MAVGTGPVGSYEIVRTGCPANVVTVAPAAAVPDS